MEFKADCVPMKWPSGPLEVARRERRGPLTAEINDALQSWHQPVALKLLHGSPVNCLVVSWASGLPQDSEQQKSLRPLIERGRERGICFVGSVDDAADIGSAVASAEAAGLSAVATEEDYNGLWKLPVIPFTTRAKAPWNNSSGLLILNDGIWPQIRSNMEEGKDQAVAGPTGIPWVDSNGWYIRMITSLSVGKTVWLNLDPSAKIAPDQAESYALALADAEAYGAHWVISLDDTLRAGLAKGHSQSVEIWRRIAEAATFFRSHKVWRSYQPLGLLGVISDFSGPDEFMGGEILNLLCRRQLPFRVIPRSRVTALSLEGLRTILYADQGAPSPELRRELLNSVAKGTLLIVPPSWRITEGKLSLDRSQDTYEMYSLAQGRIAVAKEEWQDPYQLASETQVVMSHSTDLIRLWNAGGTNSLYSAASDGSIRLLQILNYSLGGETDSISLWLRDSYRLANFWTLGAKTPRSLEKVTQFGDAELHLPNFRLYAAIEFKE
jgi:hypothetical protein